MVDKKEEFDIHESIEYLLMYIEQYERAESINLYSKNTFIKDMLYGLGLAIDSHEYKNSDGFNKFLNEIKEL